MNYKKLLTLHAERYPWMELQDYVKLLYESEFGPEIPADDPLAALQDEYREARTERYSSAFMVEAIGNGLCRFYLKPKQLPEEDLPILARCLTLSNRPHGSRRGLWDKLGVLTGLAWENELPFAGRDVETFLHQYDSEGCPAPSHSEAYLENGPAHYCVLDRDFACYAPAIHVIAAALRETEGPVLVSIDGRSASGKTTMAARLQEIFQEEDCKVFHMDDYFLPPDKRTFERLSAPGGTVDRERAAQELFEPLSRGEAAVVRPFDCISSTFLEPESVPAPRLSLIEGSYSLHPDLAAYSQVHLFVTCHPKTQLARLQQRETPERLKKFQDVWIPMEELYFRKLKIQKQCEVIIDTSKLLWKQWSGKQ